ncbi:soma ferritin-like [Onthophagus taurus]|uniref:soma ferritin-like n=1 Tax=Onthophagus taurus TaxID=166361 RepID=UPI0039BE1B1B
MSLSVRSKIFPFLTATKFLVFPKRLVSCMSFINFRHNDDNNYTLDGPKELIKTDESAGVNIVDVKRLVKNRLFSESLQDYAPIGGGFSKKSHEDSKVPLSRDNILTYLDNNDRDNHFQFHTMATQLNKCETTYVAKPAKDMGRLKYHAELEDAINKQIMSELNAAFGYLSIAAFFGRNDVGKKGAHNFFMVMCNEEIEHALRLIEYQLSRGGIVKLCNIGINESVEWCSIPKAIEIALELEKVVTSEITNVICVAKKHDDYHTENMLVSEFVTEQYEAVNKLSCLLAQIYKMGKCGVADYMIDKMLMDEDGHGRKPKKK